MQDTFSQAVVSYSMVQFQDQSPRITYTHRDSGKQLQVIKDDQQLKRITYAKPAGSERLLSSIDDIGHRDHADATHPVKDTWSCFDSREA